MYTVTLWYLWFFLYFFPKNSLHCLIFWLLLSAKMIFSENDLFQPRDVPPEWWQFAPCCTLPHPVLLFFNRKFQISWLLWNCIFDLYHFNFTSGILCCIAWQKPLQFCSCLQRLSRDISIPSACSGRWFPLAWQSGSGQRGAGCGEQQHRDLGEENGWNTYRHRCWQKAWVGNVGIWELFSQIY